uniref:Uncharacterized protein n=1 Tax=viral metagenome TaxID=1070528 RepID=A0A6C0ADY4_9ZZZZ
MLKLLFNLEKYIYLQEYIFIINFNLSRNIYKFFINS